jgi:hypothetical protein
MQMHRSDLVLTVATVAAGEVNTGELWIFFGGIDKQHRQTVSTSFVLGG